MGSASIKWQGIILRKTKLKESDLIITMLAPDGSIFQGIAKGARKPTSSFASRLELFAEAEGLAGSSKGLPIIQEVRLIASHANLRGDFEASCCASVLAELVGKAAHEDIPVPRLYDLCSAALNTMEQTRGVQLLCVTAAALLKVFALAGYRPSLVSCASCGKPLCSAESPQNLWLSTGEGGLLCDDCRQFGTAVSVHSQDMLWLQALLMARFSEMGDYQADAEMLTFAFQFAQDWSRQHLGTSLKSIPILLTNFEL